jgi:hypothetical protein
VGIATNGSATVLTVTGNVQPVANVDVEDLVVAYGQTVPKPFCASGPSSLVRIEGPISLKQRAQLTPGGEYTVNFTATGGVTVTPIDGTTGLPSGAPYRARIVERHAGHLNDVLQSAFSLRQQNELPPTGADRGSLHELLQVGTQGNDHYALDISC